MHSSIRKAVTGTLALAATAALSLGVSSEAWGTSAWDRAPSTDRTSAWDSTPTTDRTSAWDSTPTTNRTSAWD